MYAYHGIGLLALRQGDLPRALPLLERAVGICQEADLPTYFSRMAATFALGMHPLQAHCRRDLGTLYATRGQWEQARTELAMALEMYRAMDMTFWLPQAEAALARVG